MLFFFSLLVSDDDDDDEDEEMTEQAAKELQSFIAEPGDDVKSNFFSHKFYDFLN
jgi:hypothetical protein